MANSMQASEARKSAKTGPVAEPLAQPARLGYVGGRGHARLSEVAGPTERGRSRKLSSKRVLYESPQRLGHSGWDPFSRIYRQAGRRVIPLLMPA